MLFLFAPLEYMVTFFRPYGIAYFPPAVHHCNEVKECGMQPKWQQGDAKIGKNSKYTKTRYNTVKSSEITATMTLQIPMIGRYIWQLLSSLSESKSIIYILSLRRILSGLTATITVCPEPIWIKVNCRWQLLPQHQTTYLRGPESASIEIPPFRPHFTSSKI